jgi:DNA uptake protein ComE-like DNA-binding protein
MNPKKLVVFALSFVFASSFATIGFSQAKKAGKAAPKQATAATSSAENDNALDLNSAPLEKLMTLNGVDLIVAKKIVAARPYKNKNELVSKKVMSQEDLNRIDRGVTVKAPDKTPATKGKKG